MLSLFVLASCCAVLVAGTSDVKGRLIRDLTSHYTKHADPGKIDLTIGLSLLCSDYNKLTGLLTSNVWERYSWTDKRLTWNPTEYGGINSIRIPAWLIWTPDMRLYNSVPVELGRSQVNAVLKSDGSVLWIPPATYVTRCSAGTNAASCDLKIGSWTFDSESVNLKADANLLDLTDYEASCPTVVDSHTEKVVAHKYPCCEELYPSLDVTLAIKSKA